MKKLKLKKYVLPTAVFSISVVIFTIAVIATKNTLQEEKKNLNYVSNIILNDELPVIDVAEEKVINPYTDQNVTVGKKYYDYKASAEEQENSIIYHENTYIQNSGIDFIGKDQFEVVSVLPGTVSNVKEDELLGKIIEINHNNEFVSIYQSLSEVTVKKGDNVTQGQIIALSGTNKLDKDLGNHLHFEFYANGQIVNPIDYLNKPLSANKE